VELRGGDAYAQLTHAIGLNDVCDALRHHQGWLGLVGPPRRAATGSRMRANIAMRSWPKSCSGACSRTCKTCNRALETDERDAG